VTIQVEIIVKDAQKHVQISVVDTGIGIADED
jgi:signal transduction histidine kinase